MLERDQSLLWADAAGAAPPRPTLTSALRTKVAVIGAGYTGLSAALHLCHAGMDVVVLESADVGAGASGRNGGQVIPGLKHDPDLLEAMFGAALGTRLVQTVASGPAFVFDLIRQHQIDCDAVQAGWLQLATTPSALGAIHARARQWQSRGGAVETLDADAARRFSGSTRYVGGLLDRRGGTVQPLAYARGLAAVVERSGGRIFANSAAQSLTRSNASWRITTAAGEVCADQVILATNAFEHSLFEPLRRSFVAVPSYQVATEPLPLNVRRTILPQGQAVSDTWHLLRYFRLDAAGRLIMGSRGMFGNPPPAVQARHHYRAVSEIYPQLRGIRFEYHWGGMVAMTADHLPHLHELAPGLFAGLGYNGRGVAMATTMGRILAQRTLGASAAEAGFPETSPRVYPFHRFSRWGVRATIQYYRLLDAWVGVRENLRRAAARA